MKNRKYKVKSTYYTILGSAYSRFSVYKKILFFWWFIADFKKIEYALEFIEHLETKDELITK